MFNQNTVDWQAVAAIGTWAAVLVALFLPMWERHPKLCLSVLCNQCMLTNQFENNKAIRCIVLNCVNIGSFDVVIKNWGLKIEGSKNFYIHSFASSPLSQMVFESDVPKRLHHGDTFSAVIEKMQLAKALNKSINSGEIQCDDLLFAVIVDSQGREYKKSIGRNVQECIDDGRKRCDSN